MLKNRFVVFGLFFVAEFFVGVDVEEVEIAVVDFVVGRMVGLFEETDEFIVRKSFVIGHQLTSKMQAADSIGMAVIIRPEPTCHVPWLW